MRVRGPRVAIIIVLAVGCRLAGAQRGPTAQLILTGWRHSAEMLAEVADYALNGKFQAQTPNEAALKSSEDDGLLKAVFKVVRADRRYRVEWTINGETKRIQTYDGSLWYGLTLRDGQKEGSIYRDPVAYAEVNLDQHLAMQVSGLFPLELEDIVVRPMHLTDEASVLEGFAAHEARLTAGECPGGVFLAFEPQYAQSVNLPYRIEFSTLGDSFWPRALKFQQRQGTTTLTVQYRYMDYAPIGRGFYPQRILHELRRQVDGGISECLQRSVERLQAKQMAAVPSSEFTMTFPAGATVYDDRNREGNAPPAQRRKEVWPTAIPVMGGAILFAGIVIGLRRRRS